MSTDGVHVSVQTEHYNGYIANWLDLERFEPRRAVLGVQHVNNAVSDAVKASGLATSFTALVCEEYNVGSKLSAVCTDGASVMSMLCSLVVLSLFFVVCMFFVVVVVVSSVMRTLIQPVTGAMVEQLRAQATMQAARDVRLFAFFPLCVEC